VNIRRALAAAIAAMALLACGGREPKFDLQHPPAWLKRIDSFGTDVRPAELSGDCLQSFPAACRTEVLPSRTMLRKVTLRLAAGGEAKLTYTPAEGSAVSMMLDPASDAKLRVRKGGGTLVIECTRPLPQIGCQAALIAKER